MSKYYYDGTPQKESFFAAHVKLITFLIVIGLFLLICGPIFVMSAVEYWGAGMDTRPKMTTTDVITISEWDQTLELKQITQYACREKVGQHEIHVTVEIEPHYTMVVRADKNTRVVIYCELLNNDTNEQLNVLTDDIRAYIKHVEQYD